MNTQYVKEINGYMIKDEEARQNIEILQNDVEDINSVLKFHTVRKSSATYLCEFPNGKNLIVDTGLSGQWNDIKQAIDNLNINKFDYVIITHFHPDHTGNIQNLINNYDVKNAQWFIQMKPDYTNHSSDIADTEASYNTIITLLNENEITPIVPVNDSYLDVDDNIQLHFLNTDPTLAENYYNTNAEWYTDGKPNFNVFSLVTEIKHKKVSILCTGDLERPTEEQITPFLSKCQVITMPHHGVNRDCYIPFYEAIIPNYAIAQYINGTIENTPNDWVRNEFKSFMTLKDLNSKLITAKWSNDTNGLFTFISNGSEVHSNVLNGGIGERTCEGHKLYGRPEEVINYSSQLASEISLNDFISNMSLGSIYQGLIGDAFQTRYPQLYSDLSDIFGSNLTSSSKLEIYTDYSVSIAKVIKLYNTTLEFTAIQIGGIWHVRGIGKLSNISGMQNLINKLLTLPFGFYNVPSYTDDDGSVLVTNGGYQLNVTIDSNTTADGLQASILATLRYTGNGACNVASGYINTNSNPQYVWRKLN